MNFVVYVGWDPREQDAYDVCVHSIRSRISQDISIFPIVLSDLVQMGLYTRRTFRKEGRLWDEISDAPMSTEFAISRFFVMELARRASLDADWAVFCDCDFLWLSDITDLVQEFDTTKALSCVQHQYDSKDSIKMDGQLQINYARKNWSSMMAINLRSPANDRLTLEILNSVPGRDLHRFCWLQDSEIQPLSEKWNWLEGVYPVTDHVPSAIHYTRGGPWMSGWESVDYADLWLREAEVMRRR